MFSHRSDAHGGVAYEAVHEPLLEDAASAILESHRITGGVHGGPVCAGNRALIISGATIQGSASTTSSAPVAILGRSHLSTSAGLNYAVQTDKGHILVGGNREWAGPAVIRGDIRTSLGSVALTHGAKVYGQVLLASSMEGMAEQRLENQWAILQPTLLVVDAELNDLVRAETIWMARAVGGKVILDGVRAAERGLEARMDAGPHANVERIDAAGAAVVVWHGAKPKAVSVAAHVRELTLRAPASLEEALRQPALPAEGAPFSIEGWRQVRDALDHLSYPPVATFGERLSRPESDRFVQHFHHSGRRIGALLLDWVRESPRDFVANLQWCAHQHLEGVCAALALTLAPRPLADDAVKSAITPLNAVLAGAENLAAARQGCRDWREGYRHPHSLGPAQLLRYVSSPARPELAERNGGWQRPHAPILSLAEEMNRLHVLLGAPPKAETLRVQGAAQ